MNIITQYPIWFYLGCFLLGATLSFVLYRKDKKLNEFPKWIISILAFLRFSSISIIAILVLGPLLKYYAKRVEQPIIAIVQDNSNSIIQSKDSTFIKTEFAEMKKQFVSTLEKDFITEEYLFAEGISYTTEIADYKGEVTDISQVIEGIETRYYNRNLGAVIFISDGIFNQGKNPIYQESHLAPYYTIALGDTVVHKDASVNRVSQNKVAFLGNDFPVEIDLKFIKAKGSKGNLEILKGDKVLFAESFEIASDLENLLIKTNIEAEKVGLQKYSVRVSGLIEELNLLNNQKDFYIDVLDGRQRILILTEAPHPDINAIKSALNQNENYEVAVSKYADFKEEIKDFNLVVFYQLTNNAAKDPFLADAKQDKISSLFIAGASSNLFALNQQELGIVIDAKSQEMNLVNPNFNEGFPLFQLSDETKSALRKMPPLLAPFGNYKQTDQNFILFNQQIGTVKTNYPLLSFSENEGRKVGYLIAEGLWRWRIANYAATGDHTAVNELITKTVQFLAVKSDKSYFRISHEEAFYENESFRIDAQLYNESYELTNEPEIDIEIVDENGLAYSYVFSRNTEAYFLNVSGLPVGSYSYASKVKLGGKEFTENGQFTIKARQLEAQQTIANHNMLFQLSQNSGGELLYPKDMLRLIEKIKAREDISSVAFQEEEIEDVINLRWIFFLIIGLFTIEWFIRKRGGAY